MPNISDLTPGQIGPETEAQRFRVVKKFTPMRTDGTGIRGISAQMEDAMKGRMIYYWLLTPRAGLDAGPAYQDEHLLAMAQVAAERLDAWDALPEDKRAQVVAKWQGMESTAKLPYEVGIDPVQGEVDPELQAYGEVVRQNLYKGIFESANA